VKVAVTVADAWSWKNGIRSPASMRGSRTQAVRLEPPPRVRQRFQHAPPTSTANLAATERVEAARTFRWGRQGHASGFPLIMAPSRPSDRTDLAWSHRGDAVRLVLTGATFPTASRVAAIVGTLLNVVNQAEVILRGETTWVTAVRVVFNYLIPYVVASIGYLAPFRVEERHAG